jgi:cell division septal protein FtsQ
MAKRPPLEPPPQRYLRRRGNRTVRKRRRIRTMFRWSPVLLLNVALIGAAAYALTRLHDWVTTSPRFDVKRIAVAGVERGSQQALEARLAGFAGHNVLTVDIDRVAAIARQDPWVLSATVKRVLPDGLQVKVRERRPAAVAVIGGLAHQVDERGYVIGASGAGMADDLPVLTGLDDLGDDALAAALAFGVRAIERLRQHSPAMADVVSEVDLSRDDRLTVRTTDTGPLLLLDPERVERNVESFLARRTEIERRLGPLRKVDLRWADRITVTPSIKVTDNS